MLKINHETLVEAIQLYLDSGQMPNQKVQGVYLSAKEGVYIYAGQQVPELVVEVANTTTSQDEGQVRP